MLIFPTAREVAVPPLHQGDVRQRLEEEARRWERVRQTLPEVAVVDLPADPAFFVRALDGCRLFQAASVTEEDRRRTEFYRAEARRRSHQDRFLDLEEFLASLQMVGTVRPLQPEEVPRATQLVNRTNQFNLTARRCSESALQSRCEDPGWIVLGVRLADRFGDYGLVSVLMARVEGEAAEIETWVMSCRVLSRGVEQVLFQHLLERCRARGSATSTGRTCPPGGTAWCRSTTADSASSGWRRGLREPPGGGSTPPVSPARRHPGSMCGPSRRLP